MSCDGADCFGYVEIEDDKVVCYTGESNNPTIHKFCNDDIVQAVKLKRLTGEKIDWLKKCGDGVHGSKETGEVIKHLEWLLSESKK